MGKIIFLLPPSEGKNNENFYYFEETIFDFEKPKDIAINVDDKDLKCKGNRFIEALNLNKNIFIFDKDTNKKQFSESIKRYSGVMYNYISYENMSKEGKKFFNENFLILSGMYGILKPFNKIGNYKLPIESKGLYDFWGLKIIEKINSLNPDFVVSLLPISYFKLLSGTNKNLNKIFSEKRNFKIINVNFLTLDIEKQIYKKISHGVKKIKGEWIKNICEKNILDYKKFGGEIFENGDIIDINIIVK